MKRLFVCFVTLFLLVNGNAFSDRKKRHIRLNRRWVRQNIWSRSRDKNRCEAKKKNKTYNNKNSQNQVVSKPCKQIKRGVADKLEGGLDKLFGQKVHTKADVKSKKNCNSENVQVRVEDRNSIKLKTTSSNNLSLYTGTFDLIDKEGDDQTIFIWY